jgi:sugar lactone lactonase YvrE
MVLAAGLVGCVRGPVVLAPDQQTVIDRKLVEYPSGVELREIIRNLNGPIDVDVDEDGSLIVAESGRGGFDVRIFGVEPDGTLFWIYPMPARLPIDLLGTRFRVEGPVGGIAAVGGRIFVSHRDRDGSGIVTAFRRDGSHETIVGAIPAQGDHGMSDIAVSPTGRIWFGVGSATNSGVVGLDNWQAGWVKRFPGTTDKPYTDLKLLPYLFRTNNPQAGLFRPDVAVTAPMQPFNVFGRTRVGTPGQRSDRPGAAIFSVSAGGGGMRVEAHGVHCPVGIAFSELGSPYMTNLGMELRGSRPIRNDPDALLRVVPGTWYGWPDFTADLQPVTDKRYQPDAEMIVSTGYDEIYFLVDHQASNAPDGLLRPSRSALLQAVFSPLAGAARLDFVPDGGPLAEFRGHAIVPLSGDRAPFATSGVPLEVPPGGKVVRVDVARREVSDFLRNTSGQPASKTELTGAALALERPAAVKFDPRDGSMYIVDFGQMKMKGGKEHVTRGSGRILKLSPQPFASTQPAGEPG